jgi:hypothetical protein
MKAMFLGLCALGVTMLNSSPALAYGHANAYGGSTRQGAYGATIHTNAYGGTTAGKAGYGAVHTTPYGTTTAASAYHPPGAYVPPPAYGYHPPATVNYYSSGCYNCGSTSTAGAAAAGVVVGVAVGAAAASAKKSANTTTTTTTSYPMGTIVGTLPPGATMASVNGKTYYTSGNTWFSPAYGANGVYYTVVPNP